MHFLLASLLLFSQSASLGPVEGSDLAPADLERVKVGDQAPDFRLVDQEESAHQLSQYQGRKNVVLVFYRGHW